MKRYIIGNWKMNLNVQQTSLFLHKLEQVVEGHDSVEIVLAPTVLALQSLHLQIPHRRYKLAAQNFYWRDEGAFTGEVSAQQLRGLVKYALVGHSERRHVFGEAGRDIGRKVQAAVRNGIKPILCVGETAFERSEGETVEVIYDQLAGGLGNLTSEDVDMLLIAYEPVWAIGTGETPTPTDVKKVTTMIRKQLSHLFGAKVANAVPILYGGSVDTVNAQAFLGIDGINGVLVGGASLRAKDFAEIIEIAHNIASKK